LFKNNIVIRMEKEDVELRRTIEKHFDEKETKEFVVQALKIPHSNTKYWERDLQLHFYIQKFIKPLFEEFGIETWVDDYGNLIAKIGKGIANKRVLIIQHAMAWGAAEDEEEYTKCSPIHEVGEVIDAEKLGIEGFNPKDYGIEGEVVWGRDGSECVSNLIAAVEAARIIARAGLEIPGEVMFIVTAGGHQASSSNIFHLIHNDEIRADMAVHAGFYPDIVIGGVGRVDLKITVYGQVSHSSFYNEEQGLNAIDGALILLNRLKKIMPFPPGPRDPDIGVGPKLIPIAIESFPKPPTFAWGLGSAGHTRQGLVRIAFDRRVVPGESIDEAIKQIKEVVGDLSPFKYKIERGAYHFPWKVPRNAEVVKKLSRSVEIMLRIKPNVRYGMAAWDVGAVNKLGIPCVMFGAGGPMIMKPPIGPHTANEFAVLKWVYDCAKVYAHFAATSTT